MDLAQLRCLHHPVREAAARCPECRQYYCRECVTEHENRVICAGCLRKSAETAGSGRSEWLPRVRAGVWTLSALLACWLLFYVLGDMLLRIPDDVHQGTLWKRSVLGLEE